MPSATQPSSYLLGYRSRNEDEDKRLDSQHDVIKHAILEGSLIHPSIPLSSVQTSIADIACGTGIWLDDVRKTHFLAENGHTPTLIGFDLNDHAFDPSFAPAVQLIQHDCTTDFPAEYLGKFDLVNMRGLAYAVPKDGFARLVKNAIKLLRPGGYLQWLETETQLFRQFPVTAEFTDAIETINAERRSRGLVVDMPHFMLREVLRQDTEHDEEDVAVLHFNILPGGVCREGAAEDVVLNRRFSETVLESVKLLLAAPLNKASSKKALGSEEREKIERLMDGVAAIMESEEIIAGGIFPQLIAQKTVR